MAVRGTGKPGIDNADKTATNPDGKYNPEDIVMLKDTDDVETGMTDEFVPHTSHHQEHMIDDEDIPSELIEELLELGVDEEKCMHDKNDTYTFSGHEYFKQYMACLHRCYVDGDDLSGEAKDELLVLMDNIVKEATINCYDWINTYFSSNANLNKMLRKLSTDPLAAKVIYKNWFSTSFEKPVTSKLIMDSIIEADELRAAGVTKETLFKSKETEEKNCETLQPLAIRIAAKVVLVGLGMAIGYFIAKNSDDVAA